MAVQNVDVPHLITRLCQCILTSYGENCKKEWLSNPLKLPDHLFKGDHKDNSVVIHKLFKVSYDLILLRKKDWFERWKTSLSPYCECISHIYNMSNEEEREKLLECVGTVSSYTASEPLFKFLSVLASTSQKMVPTSGTVKSSFTHYPSFIFQQVFLPSESFTKIFETTPSFSFYTQELSSSTLFSGLTHTTTRSLNVVLKVPPLTDTPPDPLLRYLEGYKTDLMTPPIEATPIEEPQNDSVFDLVTSFDEPRPQLSWEGPLDNLETSYLSESGPASFSKSVARFLSLLSDISHVDTPNTKGGLPSITHLVSQLKDCFDWLDQRKRVLDLVGDEIIHSFHNGVFYILHHCQVKVDQFLDQNNSQFFLQSSTTNIQLLLDLVSTVLSGTSEIYTKGILLIDCLYNHCINYQGLPLYPLLFGLFKQTIQPYLKFLGLWVFQGLTLGSEGFGLTVDEDNLQRRDHNYWTSGFNFSNGSTPRCLSQYETDILGAGKSLNLLYLCRRTHHLCNKTLTPPRLMIANSLRQLEDMKKSCRNYKELTEKLSIELERKLQIEVLERELEDKGPVLKRRELARQAMEELKREEERFDREERERRAKLFKVLKDEAERSRILKQEIDAEEKEADRLGSSEGDQKTKELKDEARYQLEEYYQELTHQAELRTKRSQWRARRFALGALRLEFMEEMREKEMKELKHLLAGSHVQKDGVDDVVDDVIESECSDNDSFVSSDLIDCKSVPEHVDHQLTEHPIYDDHGLIPEHPIHDDHGLIPEHPIHDDHGLIPEHPIHDDHGLVPELEDRTSLEDDIQIHTDTKQMKTQTLQHISHSTIENILYTTNDPSQTHSTTRGKPPETVIEDLMYPKVEEQEPKPVSITRTSAPPSTAQKLIYYGNWDNADHIECTSDTKEEQYTVSYPSVRPYSQFNTSHPFNEPPYSNSIFLLPSFPDLTIIDESIYNFSLQILLRDCIAHPILTQVAVVSRALVQYLMVELSLKQHFVFLKRHLLLEDGEFSESLCSQLFNQLVYGQSLDELCSISFLSPLLSSSMERSLHKTSLAENLSMNLKYKPSLISTSSLKVLEFLSLEYKSQWPLNIVITTEHIVKYNSVFHFILQIKRASWILKKVFTALNQNNGGIQDNLSLRQIHAQRQELQHFVTVMENYISNQLFHLSWQEFEHKLSQANSLDELIGCHNEYLDLILSRCLLNKKAKPLLNLIDNILGAVLKFGGQLLFHFPRQQMLSGIHNSFKENTSLLLKVIQKLTQRGYQPHLQEFLLRLNFNGHYKP